MVKILIGLTAAIGIATGSFFGFEFYVQHRVAGEVEAAFAQIRATGGTASHGKVSFDLWSRTITVADIAGESAAQPPVSVKIASFVASGVRQPDATRFSADSIEATDVEVRAMMAAQAGWRITYEVPLLTIKDYSGPAGPQRPLVSSSAADVYRFALEHLVAVTASSVTAPSLVGTLHGGPAMEAGGDYTYSGLALRDIKDGRIAAMTAERMVYTTNVPQAGNAKKLDGKLTNIAAYDFDVASVAAILDPVKANDDRYYRVCRQMTAGAYTVTPENRPSIQVEGLTVDEIGVWPSRLQLPALIALTLAPGASPTPAQRRDTLEKMASFYEGLQVGNAEIRGLTVDTAEGPLKLAAIRYNMKNGKGGFALEGLDARSPNGPIKIGRFALKSLDGANMLRVQSQFSNPAQNPSPDQLFGLLPLLEGAEITDFVAPYRESSNALVNIERLSLDWGQFIGPIPSKARLVVKMSSPIDVNAPGVQMLFPNGVDRAVMNADLGAAWNEGAHTFVLDPGTVEFGGVVTASARVSLGNVPRELFSTNPLQAAIMAAQIEAGTIEIALRDLGGVDLAVTQYGLGQNLSPDAARRAIIENIKASGHDQPEYDGDRGCARALHRESTRNADHQAHAPGQSAGDAARRGVERRSARRAGAISDGSIDRAVSWSAESPEQIATVVARLDPTACTHLIRFSSLAG
jgi:hypothetical protein